VEKSKTAWEEKVVLYDKLVASHPDVERKGATMPYTSVNGNMYSYFSKDEFVGLRLPEDEREKFIAKYKTKLAEQHGIVQKEYVVVPDKLLKKTAELKKYFDISYTYASSLKPKATTKVKKK
jgi:hypothetical protein